MVFRLLFQSHYNVQPSLVGLRLSNAYHRTLLYVCCIAGVLSNGKESHRCSTIRSQFRPLQKDSEVLNTQNEALLVYAREKGYECPEHLYYPEAISATKYPYWERPKMMELWDDAERGEFDIVLCTRVRQTCQR